MLLTVITVLAVLGAAGICLGTGAFAAWAWLWALPVSFAGIWLFALLAAVFLLYLVCRRVDLSVPQEEDDPRFRRFAGIYIDALLRLTMRLRVSGREKLPTSGRFLLVCNHLCDLDPPVLLHAFPDSQLAFISKRENSTMPIVGGIMHRLMCQMINRENDREALKTILRCIQLIKEDKVSIAVFPEGYTSRDGKLHHFRSGVFKIALKTGVPIVVCTIRGTNRVFSGLQPFSLSSIHPGARVEAHLVDVISPESYRGKTAVEIGDQVYAMMLRDLGPAYAPAEETP